MSDELHTKGPLMTPGLQEQVIETRVKEILEAQAAKVDAPAAVAGVPQSGLAEPLVAMPKWLSVALVVLAVAAGAVMTLPTAGVAVPPVVLVIAGAVTAIAAALGIVSPGIRK